MEKVPTWRPTSRKDREKWGASVVPAQRRQPIGPVAEARAAMMPVRRELRLKGRVENHESVSRISCDRYNCGLPPG
jgi:hypothetical protein